MRHSHTSHRYLIDAQGGATCQCRRIALLVKKLWQSPFCDALVHPVKHRLVSKVIPYNSEQHVNTAFPCFHSA
eukprot:5286310-Karenia_brevis.AAC.1